MRVRGVGSHIWAFEAPFSLAFHGRAAPLAAAASLAHRSRSFRRCPGSVSSFRNRLFTRFSRRENGIFSIFRKRKLKTFFINWMDEEIIPSRERIFNNRGVLIIFKYISLRLKEKEGCSLNGFRIIAWLLSFSFSNFRRDFWQFFFFLREFSMEMAASGGPLIQRSAKNSRHAFSLTR